MYGRIPEALMLAVFAAGCGGGTSRPSVSVTDSVGVKIVTNSAAQVAVAARWTLDSAPTLTIESSPNGPYTLFQVAGVVPLPGGRVAVGNGGAHDVLVFGPDGKLARAFGEEGRGPGEFERIGSITALPGDSVAVLDEGDERLSVFDDAGRLAHDAELGDTIDHAHGAFGRILPLADSGLVLFTTGSVIADTTSHATSLRVGSGCMRITGDGAVLARYGSFPGPEMFKNVGGMVAGNVFFWAATDVATVGNDLVVGTEETTQLRVYGPSGAVSRIVRWPDHDRAVTKADLDSAFDIMMARVPEAQRKDMRGILAKLPHAQREPPYRSLVSSDDGDVWVGDYDVHFGIPVPPSPPARHWLVFTPSGTLTAIISTPAGFSPSFVRDSTVVGVYVDDMGVESIRAYRIRKT